MKTITMKCLAISVSFLGAVAAMGGNKVAVLPAPTGGTNFNMNPVLTATPTPTELANVDGIFFMTNNTFASNGTYGVLTSDGAGIISGVYDLTYTNLSFACAPLKTVTEGDFITDITGSISSVAPLNTVVVTMNLKGNGYVQDPTGATQRLASLNLGFTSKGGLKHTNSAIVIPSGNTGPVVALLPASPGTGNFTNANGQVFLIEETFTLHPNIYTTNLTQVGSYQTLEVNYSSESADTSTTAIGPTNITTVSYTNCQSECFIQFGVPVATNILIDTPYGACVGSYTTTNYIIGYELLLTVRQTGTNPVQVLSSNNIPIYGLSITDVPAYLNSLSNAVTINNGSNFVSSITALVTNTVPAFNSTNVAVTGGYGLPAMSDSWYEIDGTLKGGITAGLCTKSFLGQSASFSQAKTVWTSFVGTGSNTNFPYFGANTNTGVWLGSNDLGVIYVYSTSTGNSDLSVNEPEGLFTATIKQFGNLIWASGNYFIGIGTNNFTTKRYTLDETGMGQGRGSSLVVTGANGTLILGYSIGTNVIAITNSAAGPTGQYVATFVNTTGFGAPESQSVTNGLGTTSVTITNFHVCAVPGLLITNSVDCIVSGVGRGKIEGQAVVAGFTNLNALAPTGPP